MSEPKNLEEALAYEEGVQIAKRSAAAFKEALGAPTASPTGRQLGPGKRDELPPIVSEGVERPRFQDDFQGATHALLDAVDALLDLDARGALVPHGIGGHGRKLLMATANRLEAQLRLVALVQADDAARSALSKATGEGG